MIAPLLLVVAASLSRQAAGHAYVYWPTSREALDYSKVGSPYSFADKKVAAYLGERYAGKLDSKHGAGKGGATWARKKTANDWSKAGDGCNALPMGAPTATYKEGQEIEVVVPVHAEHGGEYEFRLCAKKWDTMSTDKERLECLDEHLIYRKCVDGKLPYSQCSCGSDGCKRWGHTDPNDPIYTKYPGIGLYNSQVSCTEGGYLLKMTLPPGTTCEHCTLQWYWFTFHNEEFWGCSDIKIEPKGGAPTPGPPDSPEVRRRNSSRRRPATRRRSPTRRRAATRRRSGSRRRRRSATRRRSPPSARRRSNRRRNSGNVAVSSASPSKDFMEDIIYRRLGCAPDDARTASTPSSEASVRDTTCMTTKGYTASNPCLGGLPFFRYPVQGPHALGECFRFCTSMGLDLFAVFSQGTDCRCGASAENSAVWGAYAKQAKKRGLQVSPDQLSSERDDCHKGVTVYQYSAWLETDALGTVDLAKRVSLENKAHIASIVRGDAAPLASE